RRAEVKSLARRWPDDARQDDPAHRAHLHDQEPKGWRRHRDSRPEQGADHAGGDPRDHRESRELRAHLPRRLRARNRSPHGGAVKRSRCRSCDAPIIWARSEATDRWMPLDADPRDDGTFIVAGWDDPPVALAASAQL